jgi:hypothetical protein
MHEPRTSHVACNNAVLAQVDQELKCRSLLAASLKPAHKLPLSCSFWLSLVVIGGKAEEIVQQQGEHFSLRLGDL